MSENRKLLVINPGSTSTKVSLFAEKKLIFEENLFHDAPVLLRFPHVNDRCPSATRSFWTC